MSRTLLLDSDIIAFQVSAVSERDTPFGKYVWEDEAYEEIDRRIAELAEKLEATDVVVCLTHDDNFRMDVLPSYKGQRDRSDAARPEMLKPLKEYMANEYPSYIRPGLEADDVMGILATSEKIIKGEKIIVSADKDMRTVSGKVYNPLNPKLGVIEVTPQEAAGFHMWQTICGDPTDHYKGAYRIGKASEYAKDIISLDMHEMWGEVIMAYAQARQTEEDALVQARVAKILTAPLYNFKKKEVKLWSPIQLIDGNEIY